MHVSQFSFSQRELRELSFCTKNILFLQKAQKPIWSLPILNPPILHSGGNFKAPRGFFPFGRENQTSAIKAYVQFCLEVVQIRISLPKFHIFRQNSSYERFLDKKTSKSWPNTVTKWWSYWDFFSLVPLTWRLSVFRWRGGFIFGRNFKPLKGGQLKDNSLFPPTNCNYLHSAPPQGSFWGWLQSKG